MEHLLIPNGFTVQHTRRSTSSPHHNKDCHDIINKFNEFYLLFGLCLECECESLSITGSREWEGTGRGTHTLGKEQPPQMTVITTNNSTLKAQTTI